jgi:anaerobic ribonucleoside-triphosphate reductase
MNLIQGGKMNTQLPKELETKRTKCMVYTRVMGYHRPVESFNIGKKGEHRQRVKFAEPVR